MTHRKKDLAFPVPFINSTAFRAGVGRVPRVYKDRGEAFPLCLS